LPVSLISSVALRQSCGAFASMQRAMFCTTSSGLMVLAGAAAGLVVAAGAAAGFCAGGLSCENAGPALHKSKSKRTRRAVY